MLASISQTLRNYVACDEEDVHFLITDSEIQLVFNSRECIKKLLSFEGAIKIYSNAKLISELKIKQ